MRVVTKITCYVNIHKRCCGRVLRCHLLSYICTGMVAKCSYYSHTKPLFHKFHILKLNQFISMKICCIMHQANNMMIPNNLQRRFTKNTEIHNHHTRRNLNFHVSHTNSSKRLNSVLCNGKRLSNSLPRHLINYITIHSFK